MEQQTKGLFRQQALNEQHNNNLKDPIKLIAFKSWFFLAGLGTLLFAFIIWSLWGKIPVRAEGIGILLAREGSIYTASAPAEPAKINDITVSLGQQVSAGTVVAHLDRPDLTQAIKIDTLYLNKLYDELATLEERSIKEIAFNTQQLDNEKEILDKKTKLQQINRTKLNELLKVFHDGYAKGWVTKQNLTEVEREYHQAQIEIEDYKQQIIRNETQQEEFSIAWQDKIRELKSQIKVAENKLENLQAKLDVSKSITSPVDGTVTSIHSSIGDVVGSGSPIVSIAKTAEGMDAVVYVPARTGKSVRDGMRALIAPTTVNKDEFGSILGEVSMVSAYPTSESSMMATLQNRELVAQFLKDAVTPIQVRVHLKPSSENYSKLTWSSSKGPDLNVTPGTLVTAQVTIKEQAPITLFIPTLKKLIYGE